MRQNQSSRFSLSAAQFRDRTPQPSYAPQPEGIGAIIKTIRIFGFEPAQLPVD
jgi:hypothetical protein